MKPINVYSCSVFAVMTTLFLAWSATTNDAFLGLIVAIGLAFFVIHRRIANRERAKHRQVVDRIRYDTGR